MEHRNAPAMINASSLFTSLHPIADNSSPYQVSNLKLRDTSLKP